MNTCNIIKFPIRLAWVLPGEGDLIWDPIGGFVMDMALEEDDEASKKKTNGTNQKKMPQDEIQHELKQWDLMGFIFECPAEEQVDGWAHLVGKPVWRLEDPSEPWALGVCL